MESYRVTISGKVQGVGFRYFTQQRALHWGIVGWVQNQANGTVVAEIHGPADQLEQFLADLIQGPPASKVTGVSQERITRTDVPVAFDIIRV